MLYILLFRKQENFACQLLLTLQVSMRYTLSEGAKTCDTSNRNYYPCWALTQVCDVSDHVIFVKITMTLRYILYCAGGRGVCKNVP